MSVLFQDVMTVYNYMRDEESGVESWKRSIVAGVQWRHNRNEVSVSGNVQSASRVESITIDFGHNYGNGSYVAPQQFQTKKEEDNSVWTLGRGTDILVLGVCEKEIDSPSDIREIKESYPYVVTVTAVSDNRNMPRLKHIRVVAK